MRKWLINIPAASIDLVFWLYRGLVLSAALTGVIMAALLLLLASLGIRWGW